ncbi:hypothetical protein [Pseudomonas syringae]|uniref:Uncharacterized protein n=1 Tax=Pseudomonas syringae CC1417 TaxID=1357272 RepID=A0AAU8LAU7_PSESX
MVDLRTVEQRRKIMQSVGTVHTGPEMVVRRTLFSLGYRFRLPSSFILMPWCSAQ